MKIKPLKNLAIFATVMALTASMLTVVADNVESIDYSLYPGAIEGIDIELSDYDEPALLSVGNEIYNNLESARGYIMERIAARDTQIVFSCRTKYSSTAIYSLMDRHTGNPTDGDYAAFGYQKRTLYTLHKDNIYTYTLTMTYRTNKSQEMELTDRLERVMGELNLDGLTDYQKVVLIYDYICKNVAYDYDNYKNPDYLLKYTPYAALINGKAVSQGYALLFYRMCLMAGVDARCIKSDNNMWNIVRIDGKYYNVDATKDAGRIDYSFFLKSNESINDENHIRDDKYNTVDFNTAYPMSEEDYHTGVEWSIDDNGALRIKGPGIMPDESPWAGDKSITKVVIEGVSAIKPETFANCPNITEVTADSSLKSIGRDAFKDCLSLETVKLDALTELGRGAFSGCAVLESIELPEGIEEIPYRAFKDCISLKRVSIPGSVKELGIEAFINCKALESIVIPEGVTVINADGFNGCNSLKSVYLPMSLRTIASSVFYKCTSLENISIPSGVIEIGSWAFANCYKLKSIVIPAGVDAIGDHTFYYCENLEEIYIQKGVKSIGDAAFDHCGEGLTICGYKGSFAEEYAFDNSISFFEIDGIPGDVNNDGSADFGDLTAVLNSIKGISKLTEEQKKAADVYGNDDVIDIRDYNYLYRLIAGSK